MTSPNTFGVRLIGGVFGLVFFGAGLTILGFLWLSPFGAWESPPLFFRIMGSFIAVAFVVMGGTTAAGMIYGKAIARRMNLAAARGAGPAAGGYHCSQCAAPLSDKAEVSPLGDVKCTFCGAWFNIHQSKA